MPEPHCQRCGTSLTTSYVYCPVCGTRLEGVRAAAKPSVVGYVVVCCLLGLIGLIFIFGSVIGKTSKSEPPPPQWVAAPPGRKVSPPLNEEPGTAKPLTPKEKAALRKLKAEMMDQMMLQAGYNVEISDVEGKNPALRIKYVLMNRALVYQIVQKLDTTDLWDDGFKKVILTDGYDETWTYTADGYK